MFGSDKVLVVFMKAMPAVDAGCRWASRAGHCMW